MGGPVRLPHRLLQLVNQPQTEAEVAALRYCVNRGRPSAIRTGSRTRPSDWGSNARFGPVEDRRDNRRLARLLVLPVFSRFGCHLSALAVTFQLLRVLTPLKSRSTSSPWDGGANCWHKRVPSSGGNEREVLTHPERLILTHLVLQDSRSGQGRQFRFTPPFGSSWTSSTRESGSSRRSSRRSGNDASGGPKAPRSSARPGRSGSTR